MTGSPSSVHFLVAGVLRIPWSESMQRRESLRAYAKAWQAFDVERAAYPFYSAWFPELDLALVAALDLRRFWEIPAFRLECVQCRLVVSAGPRESAEGLAYGEAWALLSAPYSGVLLTPSVVKNRQPPAGIAWHSSPLAVQTMVGAPSYQLSDYRG